jgi:hypothetical protein
MPEQEREGFRRQPEEGDVEAHGFRRGDGEAPEDAAVREQSDDEPDEAHRIQGT